MTISANVRKELFEMSSAEGKLIRIKPTEAKAGTTVYSSKQSQPLKMWTQEEHEKFLEAMEKYPSGPWKVIAAFIGTKTTRQTMTHAQKYRQKIGRWRRGLRHKGRKHASDGGSTESASDSEYSARENLFKAIEYVSGDGLPVAPNSTGSTPFGDSDAGNQLFRLAELASIEVLKGGDVNPAEGASMENHSHLANRMSHGKNEWIHNRRSSKEWSTHPSEISLSPLRSSSSSNTSLPYPPMTTCSMQINQMHVAMYRGHYSDDEDGQHGSYRLPPLKVPAHGNLAAIPPLRSKIDPTVLGRAQYTPTN